MSVTVVMADVRTRAGRAAIEG
ncbi:hypothetical protein A2U01_0090579, partial [Trifolium medium]|nr:hypothetical protein [Trifolium medium]